jgi:hypothetical protein
MSHEVKKPKKFEDPKRPASKTVEQERKEIDAYKKKLWEEHAAIQKGQS